MTRTEYRVLAIAFVGAFFLGGCGAGKENAALEAPPPVQVEHEQDLNVIQVDHPDQFPLALAVEHDAASQLVVTGAVTPDIARTVPVISLASGRVVDVRARLGDTVQKGQLLLRVRSDDVSAGYSDYRKAVADELLARKQLDRAKDLYDHGAVPAASLESAQDGEDDAKVTLETAAEHLRLLGNDPNHPSGIVDVVAPVSGVITDQQIATAGGVQGLSSPNPFTISDLSYVWVVCDVYENDLPSVHLGEIADIRLNAYPDQVLKGTISNIGANLDANIRTAKVRIEVRNPGFMRPGMFATATFLGLKKEAHTAVPASAILHLHDREWVYIPTDDIKFRRLEVVSGATLPNQMQEIVSGLQPGQKVVTSALALQNAVDNE
ncbi:MAG TPA: efflux RND transporter periplasmic adaptor subunit [Candidatus Acidoferrales bacterium]|nr:efflux RND transporter periplasmic adaptor subunit [Candidatus Acidoferrales bacterium]